jgi:drug/metabolite transporter (DMT)-like permease
MWPVRFARLVSGVRGGKRMTVSQAAMLCFIASLLSVGQVLLKLAADRIGPVTGWGLVTWLDPLLMGAIAIYLLTALLWILALRGIELSRGYPFIALSFVFTPLLAWRLLGEQLSWSYGVGLALLFAGIFIIARA